MIQHWNGINVESNYNIFAKEKQAKSALAMARISQIMANDAQFGGVITDEEWGAQTSKHAITRSTNAIIKCRTFTSWFFLAFHTPEQRDLFLEENEDLVKEYLMLD